jgi:hypothetical protein
MCDFTQGGEVLPQELRTLEHALQLDLVGEFMVLEPGVEHVADLPHAREVVDAFLVVADLFFVGLIVGLIDLIDWRSEKRFRLLVVGVLFSLCDT